MSLNQQKPAQFSRQDVDLKTGRNDMASISPQEYDAFRLFLEEASGIVLGDNKHYLVISRLTRLMMDISIHSFSDLLIKLKANSKLRQQILDAMTTNETSWFRDSYPYDILRESLLPEMAKRKQSRIKIWSAACSTGQEPYSISMVVSEFLSAKPGILQSKQIEIIGTDISNTVLEQAKQGTYDDSMAGRGLSEERKKRFFQKNDRLWHVNDEIKNRISFREINLMQSYTLLGKFDIIYCRNVLIYFSQDMKKDIMRRMAQTLNPEGYLILGGSESISGYSEEFDLVRWQGGVVYKLKNR